MNQVKEFVRHASLKGLTDKLLKVASKKRIPSLQEKEIEWTKNFYNNYIYLSEVE